MSNQRDEFWQKTASQFVIEEAKLEISTRFPEHEFVANDWKVYAQWSYELRAMTVALVTHRYSTRDTNRFETKTEKKSQRTEHIEAMIPRTIWDHIKHKIATRLETLLRRKLKFITIDYCPVVTVVVNNTQIDNHNTILEYTCPHLRLPSSNHSHVLHLAQGVPALREEQKRRNDFNGVHTPDEYARAMAMQNRRPQDMYDAPDGKLTEDYQGPG